MPGKISKKLKALIAQVSGKRAKAVIDHIVEFGVVTTEDLEKMGYAHAPRAARDVRENGIPLKTLRVKGRSGKSIAAYSFDLEKDISGFKLGGRQVFSKAFKLDLVQRYGARCAICNEKYSEIYLQIDHKVPYEVIGDGVSLNPDEFMLVCATCNRKKSWSCEQCPNWNGPKDPEVCKTCIWANPENFSHIATEQVRRTEIVWKAEDVEAFEKLKRQADKEGVPIQSYIKSKLDENDGDT